MPNRIGFAGTPDLAANCLEALVQDGLQPVVVLTQPDRPSGRKLQVQPGPVKSVSQKYGLDVLQPESLKDEEQLQKQLQALQLDVLIVVAYGRILPKWLLDTPRLGCINLHFSLLPRWRGAMPVLRAIEAGDETTGLSLIKMDEGLDTGPMLARTECDIGPDDTTGVLYERLTRLSVKWLPQQVQAFLADTLKAQPQQGEPCYADKIETNETWLRWQDQPAEKLVRKVRAFSPRPGVLTYVNTPNGHTMKILRARLHTEKFDEMAGHVVESPTDVIRVVCTDGYCIDILEAQFQGKRVLSAQALRNGCSEALGPGASIPWSTLAIKR